MAVTATANSPHGCFYMVHRGCIHAPSWVDAVGVVVEDTRVEVK